MNGQTLLKTKEINMQGIFN